MHEVHSILRGMLGAARDPETGRLGFPGLVSPPDAVRARFEDASQNPSGVRENMRLAQELVRFQTDPEVRREQIKALTNEIKDLQADPLSRQEGSQERRLLLRKLAHAAALITIADNSSAGLRGVEQLISEGKSHREVGFLEDKLGLVSYGEPMSREEIIEALTDAILSDGGECVRSIIYGDDFIDLSSDSSMEPQQRRLFMRIAPVLHAKLHRVMESSDEESKASFKSIGEEITRSLSSIIKESDNQQFFENKNSGLYPYEAMKALLRINASNGIYSESQMWLHQNLLKDFLLNEDVHPKDKAHIIRNIGELKIFEDLRLFVSVVQQLDNSEMRGQRIVLRALLDKIEKSAMVGYSDAEVWRLIESSNKNGNDLDFDRIMRESRDSLCRTLLKTNWDNNPELATRALDIAARLGQRYYDHPLQGRAKVSNSVYMDPEVIAGSSPAILRAFPRYIFGKRQVDLESMYSSRIDDIVNRVLLREDYVPNFHEKFNIVSSLFEQIGGVLHSLKDESGFIDEPGMNKLLVFLKSLLEIKRRLPLRRPDGHMFDEPELTYMADVKEVLGRQRPSVALIKVWKILIKLGYVDLY